MPSSGINSRSGRVLDDDEISSEDGFEEGLLEGKVDWLVRVIWG
jgi:hypothetical protein